MPDDHTRLIIATSRGLRLVGHERPIAFDGQHVRALAADYEALYAVVARHEVWRAPLDGDPFAWSWSRVAGSEHQLTTLHVGRGALWAGSEGAHLLRMPLDGEGTLQAVQSFETHEDRERWYTPWGGPPAVRSISSDGARDLFVNVHVGGILRSGDDGASWTQTIDIGIDVHQVVIAESAGLTLAPAGRGFAESSDAGVSWRETTEGLDFTYMRAAAIADETLLVSASDGPHGDRGAVYRRGLESGAPFERCTEGLPQWFGGNVDTFCLASAGGVSAIGAPGGGVFASEDSGKSWRTAASDLPAINAVFVLS